MKDELFTDRELADALAKVQAKHMDALPHSPDPHQFSDEFETNMRSLLQAERRRARRRSVLRYATAAVLALVIGLTLFFSFNVEARASVLTWLRRDYAGHTDYLFQKGEDIPMPDYTLTWIPDGLQCVSDNPIPVRTLIYNDPDAPERSFVLTYARTRDVGGLVLDDPSRFTRTQTQVNGNPADFYQSIEPILNHLLIWVDEDTGVYFSLASTLDSETILRIAEGIQ